MNLEKEIKQILNELNIKISIKGYRYWIEAVKYAVENNKTYVSMTHEIYPYLANKYNDKAIRVERALRHAHENNKETIQKHFNVSYKITNTQLLYLIVDEIMTLKTEKE